MTSRSPLRTRLGALTLGVGLGLCVGCAQSVTPESPNASGAASAGVGQYQTGILGEDVGGSPVEGGTLTFGAYSEAGNLDPASAIVAGSTGGVEMAAIYDVLMRYDSESAQIVPQLAEELVSNADATEWTLSLREGVRFSDGTTVDAEAVKWSLDRYATSTDEGQVWTANVKSVTTPDDRTVVIALTKSWPDFPFLLTTGPGMVVAAASDSGGTFSPVGAGAFTLERYRPGESTVLSAREDYWGSEPHLDAIKVLYIPDPEALAQSFDSGAVDAAFLREPKLVDERLATGTRGLLNMVSLGSVAVINGGEGRPGADPRVRRAMAMAVDPAVINQRVHDGAGVASAAVFPEFSRWHTEVDPLPFDPDAARDLVDEAKADGYDGKIVYSTFATPSRQVTAVAVKALLESVGFEVEIDMAASVMDLIDRVAVKRDYDLAGWGISWREAGPYSRMFSTMTSEGALSVGMPTSDDMDTLIDEFQAADDRAEQQEVMGRIQEQWNEQVPALVFGPTPEFLTWSDEVRGVKDTTNSIVLLDQAWKG